MRFAIQSSNMENSLFQLDRTMRATGSAYGHGEIDKRFLSWKAESRRDMWEKPFEMLATGVVIPRFHEADIERFRDTMDNQLQEQRWQNPRDYVVDQLETVAFYKEPLGSPRMVPPKANDRCGHKALLDQWASLFQPNRIVVAGVNVPHDALVAAYERLPYKHSAEAPHHARSKAPELNVTSEAAQFNPGRQGVEYENRAGAMGTKPDMDAEVIAAVGVVTSGSGAGAKPYATALVARELFDAATRVAGESNYFGVQTFYRPYASAGLIGYTVRGAPGQIEKMVAAAAGAFPTSVAEDALARARARAEMRVHHEQLGVARDYCDFIATSASKAEELAAAVKAVSKADVEEALKAIVAQKPASFTTGDTFVFPLVSSLNKV
ncbi:mitochondrial processing peptidase [Strigomonas culicis]|uniref:Mitochondrial processing peptidase n=2 Tax=Strigomonas culicis TaxID=28005 RepID=S9V2L4_9TRYP|nr:mitochondrial processing peptidase [Strigomonas culicis]|eukprot:EPY35284.1 mitochondrial processing peptidase [Strigomonas culicis]